MSPSPSAAATNITGPSKFLAINVSGVSGPKLPRNTTNALQPCSFTSATALSISCSFSTVVLQLYKSPLYSFTMFSRRWVERAIGKQSRLTAMIPSLTTGMLLLTIIVLFLYINYLDSLSFVTANLDSFLRLFTEMSPYKWKFSDCKSTILI